MEQLFSLIACVCVCVCVHVCACVFMCMYCCPAKLYFIEQFPSVVRVWCESMLRLALCCSRDNQDGSAGGEGGEGGSGWGGRWWRWWFRWWCWWWCRLPDDLFAFNEKQDFHSLLLWRRITVAINAVVRSLNVNQTRKLSQEKRISGRKLVWDSMQHSIDWKRLK